MSSVLVALLLISIIELSLWVPIILRLRKYITVLVIVGLPFISVNLIFLKPSLWTMLILFFSIYRVLNLLRIIENRVHIRYLSHVSRNTSLSLVLLQSATLGMLWLSSRIGISLSTWLYTVAYIQLLAAMVLLSSTLRHLHTTKAPSFKNDYSDAQLPTLTIAIPARNETDNLTQCLESLLACSYPKLEILVLDDCSQDKRTPEIIRNFAQKGVRFLSGKVPPDKWLAKNYAYQQLVDEASGALIIFCGVDTRFESNSLMVLVETLLKKDKTMISLIPVNKLSLKPKILSLMIQPSRYAWEMTLPRRLFNRPPVLSTCWIITNELLTSSGGFDAVANSISPESYFARKAIETSDGYSFIQSYPTIGITTVKNLNDQQATAVRTRYPQLHRRPEVTALVSLVEFMTLIAPFLMAFYAIQFDQWSLLIVCLMSSLIQLFIYGKIVRLTYRSAVIGGYFILPFAAIYDLGLLNYSMWLYEFKTVIWKDRNVCIPIMNVRD